MYFVLLNGQEVQAVVLLLYTRRCWWRRVYYCTVEDGMKNDWIRSTQLMQWWRLPWHSSLPPGTLFRLRSPSCCCFAFCWRLEDTVRWRMEWNIIGEEAHNWCNGDTYLLAPHANQAWTPPPPPVRYSGPFLMHSSPLAGFRARARICAHLNNKPPWELAISHDLAN